MLVLFGWLRYGVRRYFFAMNAMYYGTVRDWMLVVSLVTRMCSVCYMLTMFHRVDNRA